jgi:3'-phosphoadenosine 5'-phosphosulfate sulfotransferase (PAPS reductase)/FAD synthetase
VSKQSSYVFRHVIVAAACKCGDVIITGARHYDKVMRAQLNAFSEDSQVRMMNRGEVIQGFIDNRGDFHDREDALVIALAANQIRFKHQPEHELFSEDLY